MRVIIGDFWYSTVDATSVQITHAATDPVPTATFNIVDNISALNPQPPQEVLILDDTRIPNPAVNRLLNPALNPYNTSWTSHAFTGLAYATAGGGGLQVTLTNASAATDAVLTQITQPGSIFAGQTYMLSATVQGSSTPTNVKAGIEITWLDAGQNTLSSVSFTSAGTVSTSPVRYTINGAAPAGAVFAQASLLIVPTSGTNSGVVTFTQAQLEPEWLAPVITYPTPWCGPSQTNCVQLPLGFWIRQYRKFAGFITHPVAQDYHGNVRTQAVDASGYAVLLGQVFVNDTFSSTSDTAVMTTLANKYLCNGGTLSSSFPLLSTTQVQVGQTVTSLQPNWDDLRTIYDGLAGNSTFYYTIDYYWNLIYAPLGYYSQGITLICDDSSQPDNVLTFSAYEFSAETDFTQPGSTILTIGNGSNVSLVTDPAQIANLGALSGYFLPVGSSWMRKVNDSTLASTTDTTNRGLAELLIYDYPRNLYHLKTQVELIPGQSVQLTSATEGLSASTQLVQQTTATWIGTDETLKDVWEYQSDLGATNRVASHMISRIFRQTQSNSSAPAIAATSLVVFDRLNVLESVGTGTTVSNYAQGVLPDGPMALYPLGEITGLVADDISGNANQGTLQPTGITLGVAGLLTDAADSSATAMTFNGSTGYIALPNVFPTGNNAWSIEAWVSIPANPANLIFVGAFGSIAAKSDAQLYINTTGHAVVDTDTGPTVVSASALALNTPHLLIGAYDGTHAFLSVDGANFVQSAGTGPLTLGSAASFIAGWGGSPPDLFAGTIQYFAIYNYKLSNAQAASHYAAGT